jgi:hypothetical protein
MEASILSGKRILEESKESALRVRWKYLLEKLVGFFDAGFESDWEKKTGLEWREWHKWE